MREDVRAERKAEPASSACVVVEYNLPPSQYSIFDVKELSLGQEKFADLTEKFVFERLGFIRRALLRQIP